MFSFKVGDFTKEEYDESLTPTFLRLSEPDERKPGTTLTILSFPFVRIYLCVFESWNPGESGRGGKQ